jgi:hypothetical protein
MTNTKLLHNSFNAGEISPELFSRVDTQQFRFGAAKARNWITKASGAAQLRPGFEVLSTSAAKPRLVAFRDDGDDYIISVEVGRFRLFRNGVPISVQGGANDVFFCGDQETSGNIDLVNNVIYTTRPHNFEELEEVRVTSVGGTGEPGGLSSVFVYEARTQGPYGLQFKIGAADPVDITTLNTGLLFIWHEAGLPEDYVGPLPLSSVSALGVGIGGFGGYDADYSTVTLTSPHGWPVGTQFKWLESGGGVAPVTRGVNGYPNPYQGETFFTVEPTGTLTTSQFDASQTKFGYTLSITPTGVTTPFTPTVSASRKYLAGQVMFLRASVGAFAANTFIRAKVDVFADAAGPQSAEWEVAPSPWLEIPNNYTASELFELTYAQTAGVIRFAHRNHPVLELYKDGTTWAYRNPLAASAITLAPTVVPTRGAQIGIASSTAGAFGTITLRADTGLGAGDLVYAIGSLAVPDGFYVIGRVASAGKVIDEMMNLTGALATSALSSGGGTLIPVESTADSNTRYVITAVDKNGREFARSSPSASTFNLLTNSEAYNEVSWTTTGEAAAYRVYKETDGTELFGFISEVGTPPFLDRNVPPDYATLAPEIDTELQLDYPGAVGFFDQRGAFGGNTAKPQGVWLSSTGRDDELVTRRTQLDTDRIALEISAGEAQSVRHLVSVTELLILTNTATWALTTQNTDALTPNSAAVRLQTTVGASYVRPVMMDNAVLYASGGGHIYRLGYQLTENSFGGPNLSTRASHLFDSVTLNDSAGTKSRVSAAWFTDSAGGLLGLTYSEEEQVAGWHRHTLRDFDIVSVAAAQEAGEDRLYVAIERDGVFYIVRQQSLNITGAMSSAHLDMCFTRNTLASSGTLTVLGSTRVGASVRVTASARAFDFDMIGETIYFPESTLTVKITSRTSNAEVQALVLTAGSVTTSTNWGVSVTHQRNRGVQGTEPGRQTTAVLQAVDGSVSIQTLTVDTNGMVRLPFPCRTLHLGIPYPNELRTMPVTAQMEALGLGRMKAISHAYVRVYQSAGLGVGPDAARTSTLYPDDNELHSEENRELVEQSWTRDGQVSFVQHLPLPATVVGVTLDVSFGG